MKDFLLEAYPNPERKGCPDDATLKALAEDRLPVSDPARLHVGSCSECFAEYRGYRFEHEAASRVGPSASTVVPFTVPATSVFRSKVLPWAVAACLGIITTGGFLGYRAHHASPNASIQLASMEPVSATVNLLNSGTIRGGGDEATPLQEVSLPASIVHLSVILPRFSKAGRYDVLVSKDRTGKEVVAMGAGDAMDQGGSVSLGVTLDLRGAKAGAYFLATVRGADNGTYYYPLKIN